MSEVSLGKIFGNESIEAFGAALRLAIRNNDDYASMVELEYVEDKEEFAEVIKKFLRRYESQARRYEREKEHGAFRPSDKHLDELMDLIDKYGVRIVRAALISHALVRFEREEVDISE
ncbi:MAG TPA: hypothetical protein EYP60_04000 [bacterium (Candidatus Stahlbacteria)]|nr:hypothetical protein [Candidatus Stahlbacteria bacterium]